MKLALVTAFLSAIVLAEGNINKEYLDKLIAAKEKCVKEFSVDDSIVEDLYVRYNKPPTESGKCMVACYMEERGMMKDGKTITEQVMLDNQEKWIAATHVNMGKEVIDTCDKEVPNEENDKCDLAVDYMMCLVKRGDEAGLPKMDVAQLKH
uniref:Odorant-binding protein 8 n=1 Tax=Adelphocoris suturalis TaxID=323751 RepID=W8EGT6_9HEMI|nr:odorant binding protein 8 [Adelphocoris suturalis]ANA10234.1 odorant-binding protein 8 [Adelphocoris suturalis]